MRHYRIVNLWGFVALALVAYVLPWLVNPGAGLTFNAYDLAEWLSLHPAVRDTSPPLLVTAGLRGLLCLLAWLIAFAPAPTRFIRGSHLVFVVLVAVALLPPLEFFTAAAWGDSNYRQQFALSLLTLIVGLLGLSQRFIRWSVVLQTGIVIISLLISLIVLAHSTSLMQMVRLPAQPGPGGILFPLLHLAFLLQQWVTSKRGNLFQVTSQTEQWA